MSNDPTSARARDRSREFDIVLWGATGFTGRLVAEYLARMSPGGDSGLRLALAGRNKSKLEAVAREVGASELPILLGDSFDTDSLDAIASRAEVVISTVGPFSKYGAELVAACVRNGTDYCDSTGEANFVRAMIDAHHEAAVESGARIVPCCGYDSVPSDLGTLMVQEAFKQRFGRYASEVKLAAGKMSGGLSGGTLATVLHTVDEMKANPSVLKMFDNPYALNPDGIGGLDGRDQIGVRFDRDLDTWTAPSFMAATNTRIVRRSHALMGLPWGEGFRYSEVKSTGKGAKGLWSALKTTGGTAALIGAIAMPLARSFIEKRIPAPGEGPSQQERDAGYFRTHLVALGDGHALRGLVGDDRDFGYGSTAVMIAESALCLALEGAELGVPGGIRTPASTMGMRLVERLRTAGLTFEIQEAGND